MCSISNPTKAKEIASQLQRDQRKTLYREMELNQVPIPDRNGLSQKEYLNLLKDLLKAKDNTKYVD